MIQPVATIADLGTVLAPHPLFAQRLGAEALLLRELAACVADDPEFQRIVAVFQASSFSWNALVRELLSSPITTNAAPTATAAANGEVVAVSRRDHLCAALDDRLGFADVCGLDAVTKKALSATMPQIVAGLPSDGYGRGATAPVLPNQPTLFYPRGHREHLRGGRGAAHRRGRRQADPGREALVERVARRARSPTSSATVMGLVPSDPRAVPATTLLKGHFTSAMAQGAQRLRRAQVDVRRRVPGALRGFDRDVKEA